METSPNELSVFPREEILHALVEAGRADERVLALWVEGSGAFHRVDQYSDLDVAAVVAPGEVEVVAKTLRAAADRVVAVTREHRPAYKLDTQFLWEFQGMSPFNFVDLSLVEKSADGMCIDPSTHAMPIVYFDKCACVATREPTDEERRQERLAVVHDVARRAAQQPTYVRKHLLRGHLLEAFGTYHRWMVAPLVLLLRLKHCPQRYGFWTTYLTWDLPAEVAGRLEPIFLVSSAEEIERNVPIVERWIQDLIEEMSQT